MIAFLFALLPGFIAILPIFGPRFIPTHDGEYHIIRFWQFYTSLASGIWFPRWAPDLNNGFGIPLFTFQYPFPNYIGSMFHVLGLSYVDSVKWTLGSGYLIALIFCYLWVRRTYGRIASAVATITCAYVPYWFVDVYIRGSVGEVWGFVWIFAALYAIALRKRLAIVIVTALLVITHNIMALICIPVLLAYVYIVHKKLVVDILLGVGTASYFWIPALYEQRFIQGISYVNIFDYFPRIDQLLIPSWGSGFRGQITGGNEMSYQIGLVPLFLLIVVSVKFIRKRKIFEKKETLFALSSVLAAVLLMTPWSMPLWRIIPLVHFIQYPWRLLSVVVVMTPMLAGYIVEKHRFGWLVAVAAILLSYGYSRPVTYEPRTDGYYLNQASFAKGTSSLGNAFQTKWFAVTSDAEIYQFSLSSGDIQAMALGPTEYRATISASEAGVLTAPIAYYPGWIFEIPESRRIMRGEPDQAGLLTFRVPEGNYDAIVRLGVTSWQRIAVMISVLSLSVAVVSFILKK